MTNKKLLLSILERKFFAVESKFLNILSTVAIYVKSKCRAPDTVLHLTNGQVKFLRKMSVNDNILTD